MQRMARPSSFRLCVPLAIALIAGCVAVEDEPTLATAESVCGACTSPPLVNWVRGAANPEELYPRDVRHLHVQLIPADNRSFFAFGVGGGEALWVFRVQMGDQSNIMGAIAGAVAAHHDAGLGAFMSGAGATKGDPPHPGPGNPVGEPPFSPEFIGVVVEAAVAHEQTTQQTFDQLYGM